MNEKTPDIRWKQRFANYQKALAKLKKFSAMPAFNELEEQGLIQSFEYCYELAINVIKDFLEFHGTNRLFGSRDVIREAFKASLIGDGEKWMMMLRDRNKTVHTYNEETAKEISRHISNTYVDLFLLLENTLQKEL